MKRDPQWVIKRRLRGASLAHRRYVWRYIRAEHRWPDRDEWRYLILGRWPGF